MEQLFKLKRIGVIHSPFREGDKMPIQPVFSREKGQVVVFERYAQGLRDIEQFSHIILVYMFNKSKAYSLLVTPYLDRVSRGVFATRFPQRPNGVGISTVRLIERKRNVLMVEGIDVLDGTPLIDIKPYVPQFDKVSGSDIGWLKGKL